MLSIKMKLYILAKYGVKVTKQGCTSSQPSHYLGLGAIDLNVHVECRRVDRVFFVTSVITCSATACYKSFLVSQILHQSSPQMISA
mgnify:CR=1 FL=1